MIGAEKGWMRNLPHLQSFGGAGASATRQPLAIGRWPGMWLVLGPRLIGALLRGLHFMWRSFCHDGIHLSVSLSLSLFIYLFQTPCLFLQLCHSGRITIWLELRTSAHALDR
jgi:hypothetical protein